MELKHTLLKVPDVLSLADTSTLKGAMLTDTMLEPLFWKIAQSFVWEIANQILT